MGLILNLKALVLALVAALLIAPTPVTAIGCGEVITKLSPCLNYVSGRGSITSQCCDGVRGLNSDARSTPDRQTVCGCLKNLAAAYPDNSLSRASKIPGACSVNLPYPIRRDVDCSKVT